MTDDLADLGDLTRLSVAELEPLLADALADGDEVEAEAVRAELASRTWQWHNPYASSVPPMTAGNPLHLQARLNLARDAWDAALDREAWAEADRLEAEVADLERQLGPLPPGMP
jgi:hypothetical protein